MVAVLCATVDAVDASTVENATYVEAVNYFCEIEVNRRLLQRNAEMSSTNYNKNNVGSLLHIPQLVSFSLF